MKTREKTRRSDVFQLIESMRVLFRILVAQQDNDKRILKKEDTNGRQG